MKIIRYLFIFAAIWGVLAGLFILFVPMGTSVSVTVTSNGVGDTTITHPSFFEMQGWWGVGILIAFAALYYGPFHFFRRGSRALAALFAVAAIVLTVLAGFSIGLFYLPAALMLLVGLILVSFSSKENP